eukprot:1102895-Prorocentrum_minimum.AAC.3
MFIIIIITGGSRDGGGHGAHREARPHPRKENGNRGAGGQQGENSRLSLANCWNIPSLNQSGVRGGGRGGRRRSHWLTAGIFPCKTNQVYATEKAEAAAEAERRREGREAAAEARLTGERKRRRREARVKRALKGEP